MEKLRELVDISNEEHLKINKEFKAGRDDRINWIIEGNVDKIIRLIEKKYVIFSWDKIHIRKFVQFMACFKCFEMGHWAATCTNPVKCRKGSGPHSDTECKEDILCCYLCRDMKDGSATNHTIAGPGWAFTKRYI